MILQPRGTNILSSSDEGLLLRNSLIQLLISSHSYIMVDSLKKIGQYIAIHKTDYDFAKFMIEMPLTERLDWISDNLYGCLMLCQDITIPQFSIICHMSIRILYF